MTEENSALKAMTAPKTDKTAKSGAISTNVNEATETLVRSSLKDGIETGRKANDAFALGFSKTRKAGTEKMLESVKAATDSTASAVAAVDVEDLLSEEFDEDAVFSAGSNLLLG